MKRRGGYFLFFLLAFLILSPIVPILRVEGSGKVTVKPLFEVIGYSVLPNKVTIGEKISVSVTIKNNDRVRRDFNVGFAIQDPEGKRIYTSPLETVAIKSRETETIILQWTVQSPAIVGFYNVKIVVSTYEPHIVNTKTDKFEVVAESLHPYPNAIDYTWIIKKLGAEQIRVHFKEIKITTGFISLLNGFNEEFQGFFGELNLPASDFWTPWIYGDSIKIRYFSNKPEYGFVVDRIEARQIPNYYDQESQHQATRLDGFLITINKEEWEENYIDVLNILQKPLEEEVNKLVLDTIVAFLKVGLPEIGLPTEMAQELIEGKYEETLVKTQLEPHKEELKSELKIWLILKGISEEKALDMVNSIFTCIDLRKPIKDVIYFIFGSYQIEERRTRYSINFVEDTLITFNHVNFIVKRNEENKFEIWMVSNEEFLNAKGNVDRIADKAILWYIGTYDQLPQVFLRKLSGR